MVTARYIEPFGAEALAERVAKHQLWLKGSPGGEQADLSWAGLRRSDLRGADLRGANLHKCALSGSDLSGAELSEADLSESDLSPCNLRGSNLSRSDLARADLSDADLRHADLSGASLSGASLSGANLYEANLYGASLYGTNLSGADLRRVVWSERTIVLGPLGSRRDNLVYRIESDAVHAGCWFGTLDEFAVRVDEVYPSGMHGTEYREEYLKAIAYLRSLR